MHPPGQQEMDVREQDDNLLSINVPGQPAPIELPARDVCPASRYNILRREGKEWSCVDPCQPVRSIPHEHHPLGLFAPSPLSGFGYLFGLVHPCGCVDPVTAGSGLRYRRLVEEFDVECGCEGWSWIYPFVEK